MADHNNHRWEFFRAGGFDQVRLESGDDIVHLAELDQKLWVALACPIRGLEFDAKTLELLDTDKDGRIRSPEIIAAAKWTTSLLKNPDDLLKSAPELPLSAINDATPEGQTLLASAKQILINLGKPTAAAITPADTADTVKIFTNTRFNGDGVISPDTATDPALQSIIADIITCTGSIPDRSGKPGIDQAKLDLFFAEANAYITWQNQTQADPAKFPLGPNSAAAAAALKAVAPKIEDYFTRCRLATFDPRSLAAINRAESDYVALAAHDLAQTSAEVAAFPLARIVPGQDAIALPLDIPQINPAWRAAIATFKTQVVHPLLGDKSALTETNWSVLLAKLAPVDAWLAAKAGTGGGLVEKLGPDRIAAILSAAGGNAKAALADLITQDKSLESQVASIASVDRLVRYHRDLYVLLNNFVNFRDFYARKSKAVFQAGTLYLDQRACDLCVRVDDPAKHALLAHLSRNYLAYCDLSHKTADGSVEKMTIAAAYTAGDSDNLMVGRNGLFYDRLGRDWDATITKIVENPISIRQAFWSPYKRVIRAINEQIAKSAAAADTAATNKLQTTVTDAATTAASPPPAAATASRPKLDVGVVAALGVALGTLSTAFGYFLKWLGDIPLYYIPLYFIVVILLISCPAMIIAWFKLRQRNLGPILDANGWAVNAKAKLNIPFGRSLTHTPQFPPGSKRNLIDPYAEKHTKRNILIAIVMLLLILLSLWYLGLAQSQYPAWLPKSNFPLKRQTASLLFDGQAAIDAKKWTDADAKIKQLEALKKRLFIVGLTDYVAQIDKLKADLDQKRDDKNPVTPPAEK
ncbi:MAG: hypothetical protein FWD61_11355 [Phycisphaerales bacterium]|nr:hypothetical protein [Phycisphaerales bacterium]